MRSVFLTATAVARLFLLTFVAVKSVDAIEIMFEFRPQPIEESGDYYETLGVPHNADLSTIKKTGKVKGIRGADGKLHPDDKFIQISHAYKVLSDPEQREIYDRDGHGGMKKLAAHPMHPANINPLMLFAQLLSGLPFRKPGEAYAAVSVKMEMIYTGGTVQVKRVQQIKCENNDQECLPVEKSFDVVIEPGFPSGAMVKVKGAGDYSPGVPGLGSREPGQPEGKYGDLHVRVNVQHHERFQREGRMLYTVQDISIVQALLGVNTTLKHLGGHTVRVQTMPGVVAKHGSAMRLVGEGLPSYHGQGKGDLVVHFNVKFPDNAHEVLQALGVPSKEEADEEAKEVLSCQHELANLKAARQHATHPCPPCHQAGKVPIGDWSASKVMRHTDIEYLQSAAAHEL